MAPCIRTTTAGTGTGTGTTAVTNRRRRRNIVVVVTVCNAPPFRRSFPQGAASGHGTAVPTTIIAVVVVVAHIVLVGTALTRHAVINNALLLLLKLLLLKLLELHTVCSSAVFFRLVYSTRSAVVLAVAESRLIQCSARPTRRMLAR